MPVRKNNVVLTGEDRERLEKAARSNKASIRERKRARILLLADAGQDGNVPYDVEIAAKVSVCTATVASVRDRYAKDGLDGAVHHKEQANRKARVLDGVAEAHLIATVCSPPPEGYKRWSLHLLKDRIIEEGYVDTVSHETVRRTLKKTNSSRG